MVAVELLNSIELIVRGDDSVGTMLTELLPRSQLVVTACTASLSYSYHGHKGCNRFMSLLFLYLAMR